MNIFSVKQYKREQRIKKIVNMFERFRLFFGVVTFVSVYYVFIVLFKSIFN